MPIRKFNNDLNIVSSMVNAHSIEQNIVNNILDERLKLKETQIIKLSGVKTEVTYFSINTDKENNYLVNTNRFNDIDPNVLNYKKIDKFIIIMKSAVSENVENENGFDYVTDGSAYIMPRTIKPSVNDFFVMKCADKLNLYRVSEVNIKAIENDSGYEINFYLYTDNFIYSGSKLEQCVVDNYIFEYQHSGTEYRSIFNIDEYEKIKKLKLLYNLLGNEYLLLFYKKVINTFIFLYDTVIAREEIRNYVDINNNLGPQTDNTRFIGKEFYDSLLIEFINKNKIFTEINSIIIPTEYTKSDKNNYNKSIFRAVEERDYRAVVNSYFLPVQIKYAVYNMQPILYGKYELIHVSDLIDGAITLLPPNFLFDIKTVPTVDFNNKRYKDMIVLINEIISLFLRKDTDDTIIIDGLLCIDNNYEKLKYSIIKNEYKFYLYPILAYIIKYEIEKLVNKSL